MKNISNVNIISTKNVNPVVIYLKPKLNLENWRKTQLPVNCYAPKVYQSAKSESNDVFLSSCVDDIAVVIEDLDGLGASVKVPTVRHV